MVRKRAKNILRKRKIGRKGRRKSGAEKESNQMLRKRASNKEEGGKYMLRKRAKRC
jgi:hypothetical protein